MDSSIRRALEKKSAAAMVVAANGASARLKVGACFRKRRTQNWPRW
jgi:hypothetical protein